jgi:5-formyltetrahydrofolate cyclo-ligase
MSKSESNVPRENCISSPPLKHNLRAELIGRRVAMPVDLHATASSQIVARLAQTIANLIESGSTATVGLYWPIKNEIDPRALVTELAQARPDKIVRWALPTIEQTSKTIIYGLWKPQDAMVEGALGIMQPARFESVQVDLMLVPCVGFNDQGHRIGYGGGYFDRTLAHNNALTIGVAFDFCKCEWSAQDHDKPLDLIVTETSTLKARDNRG